MSKRRNLLMKPIFIGMVLLVLGTCLQAEVYEWNDASFQYLISQTKSAATTAEALNREDGEDGGESGTANFSLMHAVDVKISKVLSAFFQTDMNWEDRNPKNLMTSASVPASFYKNWRVSGTYNRFQAKVEQNSEISYTKFQYRNQYFAPGRTNELYIFIKSDPSVYIDGHACPEFIHDYYANSEWKSEAGTFEMGGRIRAMNYRMPEWNDLGELSLDSKMSQRNETFLNQNAKINTIPHLSLLLNLYAKHDAMDTYLDYTSYGLGLAFDQKFDPSHMLDASIVYDRQVSSALLPEKDHYATSQMRYTQRFGTKLAAFVSYINRSVYSEHERSMLLISNAVRLQARYSFDNDISGDSYLIIGGKLSQENKTSIVFGEFNYPVMPNLYVNVTDKYSPTYLYDNAGLKDYAHENEAGLGFNYYFTPWQLVYVSDTFSLFGKKGLLPANQQLLTIGTKLVF